MEKRKAVAKDIFIITTAGERKYWRKCGAAFVNRDGSLNLKLDMLPDVQLQIRDKKPKQAQAAQAR